MLGAEETPATNEPGTYLRASAFTKTAVLREVARNNLPPTSEVRQAILGLPHRIPRREFLATAGVLFSIIRAEEERVSLANQHRVGLEQLTVALLAERDRALGLEPAGARA